MTVTLEQVNGKKDLKTFIYLPEKLHAGHKNWVHPIYSDEFKYFNPEKNPAFASSDTRLLLAFKGGRPVGRIMGIINRRYNETQGEKTARFGFIESPHDEEVVRALLTAIEDWAREKGMNKIIGPYGFTDQDPEGFLVEGFEHRATIATCYNFEWMPELVEKQGYTKELDYYVYKLDVPKELPDFYKRICERVERKGVFNVIEFKSRKQLKSWVKPILHLMNECYSNSNIYGYANLDEKEMEELGKRYIPVLDPRFVKAVKKDEEVVAFIIGIPDITEGIQKARGRLFPFGFLKILRAARTTKQLDLLLGAVKDEYRGRGLDAYMGSKMIMSAHEAGLEIMDTHHEMETNVKVRAEMEKMGGKLYKRYRVFTKALRP